VFLLPAFAALFEAGVCSALVFGSSSRQLQVLAVWCARLAGNNGGEVEAVWHFKAVSILN